MAKQISIILASIFLSLITTANRHISTFATLTQPPAPTILDVIERDGNATIYWNSKTNTYDDRYDPDKVNHDIYSYLVEWGEQGEPATHSQVTPYRAFFAQPLDPDTIYEARVYALDAYGVRSTASEAVQFQANRSYLPAMRERLNGFFDDFNQPMGAFEERKWNMAFSGCTAPGQGMHHINHESHAHSVAKSYQCDRAVSIARAREVFDFTNRTGTIEFELDGSKRVRQLWYLDLYPDGPLYTDGRKRDISGHVSLDNGGGTQADPAYILRFVHEGNGGSKMALRFADENGYIHDLSNHTEVYRNGACGWHLAYCPGENLMTIPNLRRHFKIELSRTDVKMWINDILVIDASLAPIHPSGGLPYERAHLGWLLFSYNTTKENLIRSVVHWDNFGFDAPEEFSPATVVHNYTDGRVGPEEPPPGNYPWGGPLTTMDAPLVTTIPIPDSILDSNNNWPLAELMFTLQGTYHWPEEAQTIVLNEGMDKEKSYVLEKPTSTSIPNLPFNTLINAINPHSILIPIDPENLYQGNNSVTFYFDNISVHNIHIELTYPTDSAPSYTQPATIFADYPATRMPNPGPVGPNAAFTEIDGHPLWNTSYYTRVVHEDDSVHYIKTDPVSGQVPLNINVNSDAQFAALGHAKGITHYDLLLNEAVLQRVQVNTDAPLAYVSHENVMWDTTTLMNGTYELFIKAYDVNGTPSLFDLFQADSDVDEYMPILITVANPCRIVNAPNLQIAQDGTDAMLSWEPEPGSVGGYRLWQSDTPYFAPSDEGVNEMKTADNSWRDTGATASPDNHFYMASSINNCEENSANSARKGEFTFVLEGAD